MPSKSLWLVLLLLILPVIPLAVLLLPQAQLIRYAESSLIVWPANTNGDDQSGDLSALVPAQQPVKPEFAAASSGSNNYWVGAQASDSAALPNTGIQTTIQVVSQQVVGCLSYWVSEEASSTVWGQVGYYICNGSTPVAFYQIWKSGSVLVTGTTSVPTGSHQFSMYVQSGNTWAYALDGRVFGTFDMGASISSSTYPVQALSEEGYVSGPWNPTQVDFGTAIQVLKSGTWASVRSAFSPYGCTSTSLSCWGVQGNLQNPSLSPNAVVVGGGAPSVAGGTSLWNAAISSTSTTSSASSAPTASTTSTSSLSTSTTSLTSSSTTTLASATTTTSISTTSTSTATSSATTSVTTASTSTVIVPALTASLTALPTVNTQKSFEYLTVNVIDQGGNPVGGASVSITITTPTGKTFTGTGTTDINGLAYFQYRLSAAAPLGAYTVSATVAAPGYISANAVGTFTVG